jgi:hypothetical protein
MTKTYGNFTDFLDFGRSSSATYLDSDGKIKTATTNTPRIEYDANGAVKGLLIEEGRTNLLPYSNGFDNSAWIGFGTPPTVTANAAVSPSGNNDAYKINGVGTGSGLVELVSGSASTDYTASLFIKQNTSTKFRLYIRDGDVGNDVAYMAATLSSGVVTVDSGTDNGNFTLVGTSVQDYGNDWYRIAITATTSSSTSNVKFEFGVNDPSGTGDLFIYGAQLEAGSFATSYIPTTGSTATRSADIASIDVDNFGFNKEAGSIFVDGVYLSRNTPNRYPRMFELRSSSNVSLMAVYDDPTVSNDYIRYIARNDAGTSVLGPANLSGTNPNEVTAAMAYAPSDLVIYGGNSQNNSSSGTIGTGSSISIGAEATTNFMNGHIKSIKYYPRRLSNAQLQELTS